MFNFNIVTTEKKREDKSIFFYMRYATVGQAVRAMGSAITVTLGCSLFYLILFGIIKVVDHASGSVGTSEMLHATPTPLRLLICCVALTWFMRGKELRLGFSRLYLSEWFALNLLFISGYFLAGMLGGWWWLSFLLLMPIASFLEQVAEAGQENHGEQIQAKIREE